MRNTGTERKSRSLVLVGVVVTTAVVLMGLGLLSVGRRGSSVGLRLRYEGSRRLPDGVIALDVADVDQDGRQEFVALLGQSTESDRAELAIYRGAQRAGLIPVDKITVSLDQHTYGSPPAISVGQLGAGRRTQIMVSNGPLVQSDGMLKLVASRERLAKMVISGGLGASLRGGGVSKTVHGAFYINRTGFAEGDALLLLWAREGADGPLTVSAPEGRNPFGLVGSIALLSRGGHCFGDVDNDGRNEVIATFWTRGTSVYALYPPGHLKARLDTPDPIQPMAVGDLDCDGKNEVFAAQYVDRLFGGWLAQPAVVQIGHNATVVRPVEGLVTQTTFSWRSPCSIGDIDNDGTNELILVDRARPEDIQVYSVER